MLCRNLSVTFWATIAISCGPFWFTRIFSLSFLLLPTLLKVPLKSHSVCGTKSWPRYCRSIHPELLISSTWTPRFGLVCSELPTNLVQESLWWEPQKPESYFTAVVFLSLLDSTGAFLHPWLPSLLLTFLASWRHPFGIPTGSCFAWDQSCGSAARQDWRRIGGAHGQWGCSKAGGWALSQQEPPAPLSTPWAVSPARLRNRGDTKCCWSWSLPRESASQQSQARQGWALHPCVHPCWGWCSQVVLNFSLFILQNRLMIWFNCLGNLITFAVSAVFQPLISTDVPHHKRLLLRPHSLS